MVNTSKNSKNTNKKLTINEIVDEIKEITDLSKQDIKQVVNAFGVVVFSQLKKGNEIGLTGHFIFSARKSEAKEMKLTIGKNKGEIIKVPAKMVPACKFGSIIKEGLKSVKVK